MESNNDLVARSVRITIPFCNNNEIQSSNENSEHKTTKRIVCISDSHTRASSINIPFGDILIHAGDFTQKGTKEEAQEFNDWLGSLPHKHKIIILGNHESKWGGGKQIIATITNAIVLSDKMIEIDGIRMYGTIWKPDYNKIPLDVDILITHEPPLGKCDMTNTGYHIGSQELADVISLKRPKIIICGHIHEAYGVEKHSQMVVINAATTIGFKGPKQRNAIFFDVLPKSEIEREKELIIETVDACKSDTSFSVAYYDDGEEDNK
eukprot:TRINITY_DN5481_c0_g1_i1.p1 TRINITY_DN5481_c0_g1~~TRINITY_DN5481_c0_g1_i1.p1  ORF type:complete len:265 (+),score=59.81 TRINITY_DN5481_c0_g1_i1:116-910(+)